MAGMRGGEKEPLNRTSSCTVQGLPRRPHNPNDAHFFGDGLLPPQIQTFEVVGDTPKVNVSLTRKVG